MNYRVTGGGFETYSKSVFQKYNPSYDRTHAAHSIYFQVLGEHGYFVGMTVPERVKAVRQQIITRLTGLPADDPLRRQSEQDLEDVFLVVQLFSYPGDYVAQKPSVERIAETLDKLEEDVLGVKTARIRGARKATVVFGEPIRVEGERGKRVGAAVLTRFLEERVQALLDDSPHCVDTKPRQSEVA